MERVAPMSFRTWQLVCFVGVILGITWINFPVPKDLVQLYLDSGEIRKASALADEIMTRHEGDFDFLLRVANIRQQLGKPEEAIQILQGALEMKPRNLGALYTLAKYYEWDGRPRESVPVYERIVEIRPEKAVLTKLVGFYRYYGDFDKETLSIARLAMGIKLPPKLTTLRQFLDREIKELSEERIQKGPNAVRDYLLQGVFGFSERMDFFAREGGGPDFRQMSIYVMERYVGTGFLGRGLALARELDAARGGIETQLALSDVLGWNGSHAFAVSILQRLAMEHPQNARVLESLARSATAAANYDMAASALERLDVLKPGDAEVSSRLVDTYYLSGRYSSAVKYIRKLIDSAVEFLMPLRAMLGGALQTGDKKAMEMAVREAENVSVDDAEVLELKTELYLALEQPAKAYPLLRDRAITSQGDPEALRRMLEVAGFTNDAQILDDAAKTALDLKPADAEVLRLVVDTYLGLEKTDKAYAVQKKLLELEPTPENASSMLAYAGFSGQKELVREAVATVGRMFPKNVRLAEQAGEVSLWVLPAREAYPIFVRIAELDTTKSQVLKMIEVASFSNDRQILRDSILLANRLLPDDDEIGFLAAEMYANNGDAERLLALMNKMLPRTQKDKEALLRWAGHAEAVGLDEDAYLLYEMLFRGYPGDPAIQAKLTEYAGYTGRNVIAARLLGAKSDAAPADYDKAWAAGQAWSDSGRAAQAIPYLERAYQLQPKNPSVARLLLANYSYAASYKPMVKLYESLPADTELTPEERRAVATAYLEDQKPQRAVPLLAFAEKTVPMPKEDALLLARAYGQAGKMPQANALYRRIAKEWGDDPEYLASVGAEALFAEQMESALQLFGEVLKKQPDNPTALKGTGMVYAATNAPGKGVELLKHYLQVKPNDADAHFRLAELYTVLGQEGPANDAYNKALQLLGGVAK